MLKICKKRLTCAPGATVRQCSCCLGAHVRVFGLLTIVSDLVFFLRKWAKKLDKKKWKADPDLRSYAALRRS